MNDAPVDHHVTDLPVGGGLKQDVGHLLFLHLVGVARALDEHELVFVGGGHVRVYVFQIGISKHSNRVFDYRLQTGHNAKVIENVGRAERVGIYDRTDRAPFEKVGSQENLN